MATQGGTLGSGMRAFYSLNNSPQTWTEIPGILDITIPAITRDRVETTVHGATSLRSYIPGLGDVSDAELELLLDLTANGPHLALFDHERAQTVLWLRFQMPDSADLNNTLYFAVQMKGRVASWVPGTPIDDKKTITVTFQHQSDFMAQKPMASVV